MEGEKERKTKNIKKETTTTTNVGCAAPFFMNGPAKYLNYCRRELLNTKNCVDVFTAANTDSRYAVAHSRQTISRLKKLFKGGHGSW